jgi:hypothetical protein
MRKNMKKSLLTVAIAIMLSFALVFSASAVSFTHLADDLKELGLFHGTDAGYSLDRAANRMEAVVMLVRLLGQEEEALNGNYAHPFTDVPEWASPYVAYAYEKSLTTGTSSTTFGSRNICNARQYVTFVLRALGYSDSEGDFTYAQAIEFGKKVGIIDDLLARGDFLRNEMVAVSYLALGAEPKGGEYKTLLEKLVSEGAVTQTAAAVVQGRVAVLNEFLLIGSELASERRFAVSMKLAADIGMEISMDMGIIIDGTDILAALGVDMQMMGEEMSARLYIADGVIYFSYGEYKMKLDLDLGDMEDLPEMPDLSAMADIGEISITPIYFIKEVTKSAEGDLTVYTVTLVDGLISSVMDMVAGLTEGFDLDDMGLGDFDLGDLVFGAMGLGELGALGLGELSIGEISFDITGIKVYTDSDGALKKAAITMGLMTSIDFGGLALPFTIVVTFDFEITAKGDAVKIDLPNDLGTYLPIDAGALRELVPTP